MNMVNIGCRAASTYLEGWMDSVKHHDRVNDNHHGRLVSMMGNSCGMFHPRQLRLRHPVMLTASPAQ